jgi:DNA-binding response OmpR family regulator
MGSPNGELAPRRQGAPSGGALRVLLVDDEPLVREPMTALLEERGHAVVALGDGAAAWRALQEESFSLVLLDLGLPEIDGLELCRRLRRLPQGDDSVVLVVTGRTAPSDLRAVLEAGADDYLAKPFAIGLFEVRLAVMERRVAEVARRRRSEAELAAQARSEGAVKTALTAIDRLGNQLAVLVANADLLGELVDGEARDRAEEIARGGRRVAQDLRFLGRIARLEERIDDRPT